MQRLILNFDFSDTQGTMILKSNLLKNKKLYCQEFLITTEIVLIAHTSKAKIQEVPVFEQEQKSGSTVKPFRDGTRMLIDLFMLRKNMSSNKISYPNIKIHLLNYKKLCFNKFKYIKEKKDFCIHSYPFLLHPASLLLFCSRS